MNGPRKPRWSFMLLDSMDRPLGLLDGVTGGSCEIVAQSRLGGSASLTLDDRQHIDWMSHRVQATYDPGVEGVEAWPVGTWLFTSPTERHTATGLSYGVGLLSKMVVIDEDTVEARYSVAAGVEVIPLVVALIQSTGENRISVTESDVTLTSGITWDAGTSKLTIINALLTAVGYWSLWCDGSGTFRVEPYVDPASRPVSWTFEHGAASLYLPDWSREQNLSAVPNRVVLVTTGNEDTEPLVGVATNEDPDSRFSHQQRGRWITPPTETVEAASQEIIDQLAARRLLDRMDPVSRFEVMHAVLPLDPNDLVVFTPDEQRRLATIQRMSMPFVFDADARAEWRQVWT